MRRLIARFPHPMLLRACYEAGPTGCGLARLLRGMGVSCEVAAPALISRAPGDKVKTDKRDCRRLARLFGAGELVTIPTEQEEAVRDLCRARADMVSDVHRARRRLSSFLLRHGMVYRQGSAWMQTHERWLAGPHFDEPALRSTFHRYRAVLAARDAELALWKLICKTLPAASRSPSRCVAGPATVALPSSVRSRSPLRCATGDASRTR